MSVVVVTKRSQSFGMTLAVIVVIAFVGVGMILRATRRAPQTMGVTEPSHESPESELAGSEVLAPVLFLDVEDRTLEKYWTAALAVRLSGQTEVVVPYGRVDVLTKTYAIEVDFLHKWKEGLGQAIHYGAVEKISPCLALIYERTESETEDDVQRKLQHIESLCVEKGVRLVILKQKDSGESRG